MELELVEEAEFRFFSHFIWQEPENCWSRPLKVKYWLKGFAGILFISCLVVLGVFQQSLT